ncbi:transglutaminase family protein [Citreicella sp. C3M06]|uniref:transglutaminase-like domain-containing protein n=1 Tax=Citreicella sp. C3M06 TaxID=2841564 RepID=UPI001C0933B4|nr:transglutaminase family protein [Citreicella sp. C3M06]MBU2959973.1 transglutaminase family protein [Citreicella sp. C3M06]
MVSDTPAQHNPAAYRIRLGCRFQLDFPQPTPLIAMLNVHYSRVSELTHADHVTTQPSVPQSGYRDSFGNWCVRMVAPEGRFSIGTDTTILDPGHADILPGDAVQSPVERLPHDTLIFLLGSRYCDTDLLSEEAWRLFSKTPPGGERVQAICDFVHNHIRFDYLAARATRSAAQAYAEGTGVCRDYAHLAIALCRGMNIPARYCTGYLGDIGQPLPYPPGDFAAWMEVWLGGKWWTFDPRNNTPRQGRVLIARGRDAADVPMILTFGTNTLAGFEVWSDLVS